MRRLRSLERKEQLLQVRWVAWPARAVCNGASKWLNRLRKRGLAPLDVCEAWLVGAQSPNARVLACAVPPAQRRLPPPLRARPARLALLEQTPAARPPCLPCVAAHLPCPPAAGADPPLLARPASPPLQEQTKAWLHILLDVAVMVCVLLSDAALPHSPAPLPTLVVTSFLGVLDMVGAHGGKLVGVLAVCGMRPVWERHHQAIPALSKSTLGRAAGGCVATPAGFTQQHVLQDPGHNHNRAVPWLCLACRSGWTRCCGCTPSSGSASSSWRRTD